MSDKAQAEQPTVEPALAATSTPPPPSAEATAVVEHPLFPLTLSEEVKDIDATMKSNMPEYWEKGLDVRRAELVKQIEGGKGEEAPTAELAQPFRLAPPADASEAEVATWRQQHGIPTDVGGYELVQVDGHTWSERDQPMVDSFNAVALEANLPVEQHQRIVGWYAQQMAAVHQDDIADKERLKEALIEQSGEEGWKGDVRRIKGYLATLPDGLGDHLLTARLGNGQLLVNHPEMFRMLLNQARSPAA
jgi:hypothetical protein